MAIYEMQASIRSNDCCVPLNDSEFNFLLKVLEAYRDPMSLKQSAASPHEVDAVTPPQPTNAEAQW